MVKYALNGENGENALNCENEHLEAFPPCTISLGNGENDENEAFKAYFSISGCTISLGNCGKWTTLWK